MFFRQNGMLLAAKNVGFNLVQENVHFMKSVLIILSFLVLYMPQQHSWLADGVIDQIALSFRNGNSKEVGAYFSSSVSLAILDDNNTYSKNQAEILIHNFFDKYAFRGCKILHRMETNSNSKYAVLELQAPDQKFRVSLSLKNFKSKFLITDLRIDKVK